ncbi:MAG: hypothetical protein ABF608_11355 [Sporolactobacillus sp.]
MKTISERFSRMRDSLLPLEVFHYLIWGLMAVNVIPIGFLFYHHLVVTSYAVLEAHGLDKNWAVHGRAALLSVPNAMLNLYWLYITVLLGYDIFRWRKARAICLAVFTQSVRFINLFVWGTAIILVICWINFPQFLTDYKTDSHTYLILTSIYACDCLLMDFNRRYSRKKGIEGQPVTQVVGVMPHGTKGHQ